MEPASRQEQWSAPGTARSWVQRGAGSIVAWARRDSLAAEDLDRIAERGDDVRRRASELLDVTIALD